MATKTKTYNPWRHAEELGARIIYRDLPDPLVVAAYSPRWDCIFVRPGLGHTIERCAIAHELIHWQHGDRCSSPKAERRARDRAASALISQQVLDGLLVQTLDVEWIARELQVTVRTLTAFLGFDDAEVVRELERVA